jgi:uncharacterized damage-inducible protein DinB
MGNRRSLSGGLSQDLLDGEQKEECLPGIYLFREVERNKWFIPKGKRMQINQIKELFAYDRWANERLWRAVADLNPDALSKDMHNGVGSIQTTLLHLVSAIWVWRTRWQGGTPTGPLLGEDFPTLQLIHARWQEEENQMQRFLLTLHDEDLSREFQFIRPANPDRVFTQSLWKTMLHLLNHQTQHRSEIAMQLTILNHSPGELGMSNYFYP